MRRRAGLAIAVVAISAVSGASLAATAADEDQVPVLVPAEPEQSANGPRVVQSWTGSAIYMRDGWSLEVLDPEPDLAAATAGEAWEAMRLTSPLGQRTCSLYVALAEDGQPSLDRTCAHTKPRPIIKPLWDFTGNRPTRLYPDPAQRLAPAKAWYDDDWSAWTSTCHPHLEHEVLQVWACAQVVGTLEPMELALSLIHISEPTRPFTLSRMPSSA